MPITVARLMQDPSQMRRVQASRTDILDKLATLPPESIRSSLEKARQR